MTNNTLSLNPLQQQAVTFTNGPLVIIAGPGTGKTHTLVEKIRYLIKHENIDSKKILALTFTKKAAQEMRERVHQTILSHSLPQIATFHSFAYPYVCKTFPNYDLISNVQKKELVKTIAQKTKLSLRTIEKYISNHDIKIQNQSKSYQTIQKTYTKLLQKKKLFDYNDILLRSLEIFQKKSPYFQTILVDEFQDTNSLQYQMIKLLSSNAQHVCIIGDPKQSIYAFRGAMPQHFSVFKHDFPDYKEIVLQNNYRSTENIVQLSTHIFPEYKLKSNIQKRGTVHFVTTRNEYTEIDYVIRSINQHVGGTDFFQASAYHTQDTRKTQFSDFAIMYRYHALNTVLQNKLHTSGIPYQVIGGNSMYEQDEIQFLLTILQIIHSVEEKNEANLFSQNKTLFEMFFHSPILDLQQKDINMLIQKIEQEVLFLYTKYNTELEHIVSSLQQLISIKKNKNFSLTDLVNQAIQSFNLQEKLKNKEQKLSNLQQFCNALVAFQKKSDALGAFLSYIQYLEKHEYYDKTSNKVTLMTIHAAKGLEFKHVYIIGFEQGIIPFSTQKTRSISYTQLDEQKEEERRLLYVAVTRAKRHLTLLRPLYRYKQKTKPSIFQKFFPPKLVEYIKDDTLIQWEKKQKKIQKQKQQMKLF